MHCRNFHAWIIFCLWLVFTLPACRTPNVVTKPSAFAKTIKKASKEERPTLMFSGVDTFSVTHLMIENARRDITVQLNRIDSFQRRSLVSDTSLQKKQMLLYMVDSISYTLDEPHTIPIKKIARIELKD